VGVTGCGRPAVLATVVLLIAVPVLRGQAPVRGSVLTRETDAPIPGAVITTARSRRSATADRLGGFTIWLDSFPDTLRIAAIGYSPDTLAVHAAQPALQVRLSRAAVLLSDVIVTGPLAGDLNLGSIGRWELPLAAARAVPPAVETDVFRALTLIPGVSFTSPLSARPLIRGYDASESSYRVDGFELIAPYHIGRIFSAFPADAAQQVSVATAPGSVDQGGALAGSIDITGKTGTPDTTGGGANVSLASSSAWLGGGSSLRWFGAARLVYLQAVELASRVDVPYSFQDVYANAALIRNGQRIGRVTVFGSRDHLADRDEGQGMDWSNILVGVRGAALSHGGTALGFSAVGTSFANDAVNVPARSSQLDLHNRFSRVEGGLDLTVQTRRSRLALGLATGYRVIANRITPRGGDDFEATDRSFRNLELSTYAEWSQNLGTSALSLGIRGDVAGTTGVWQPRARVRFPVSSHVTAGVSLGRTGRLFHLVSDPQSEPDIAFYDFWLTAGRDGIPVPTVDHATADLDLTAGVLSGRLSGFVSRASGLVELRPSTDQDAENFSPFRYGRARTWGIETQVALRGTSERGTSVSLTSVFSGSQRSWGGASWTPWAQDRRHLLRLLGQMRLSGRWTLFGAFEAVSGPPLTPVEQVVEVQRPGAEPGFAGPQVAYVHGRENSARSPGTARGDLALSYGFTGPWRSRMALGLSVINLGFGPVAPVLSCGIHGCGRGTPEARTASGVEYRRAFDLPAIPTVTLRMEF
jgi:hypothetical protein